MTTTTAPTSTGVTTTLVRASAAPLTGADVLRAFDRLRNEVVESEFGTAGAAIGYDDLEIAWNALRTAPEDAAVALSAVVVDRRPWAVQVEYLATLCADHALTDPRTPVLARARGWTLTPGAGSARSVDKELS
ncbi:hypothetical protein [Nocardioides ultimimeridianus]